MYKESELVSGFMTEHAAVIFVFFFLAEYASILLMCTLISLLFLGGYSLHFPSLIYCLNFILHIAQGFFDYVFIHWLYQLPPKTEINYSTFISNPLIEGMLFGFILGLKSCIMMFSFIWARASLPRVRYDQLMSFCWTILLPLVIAFIVLFPCLLYFFEITSANNYLL